MKPVRRKSARPTRVAAPRDGSFGLAALDLVLHFRARMVRVAVDLEIARMNANDCAAGAPGLRIPAHLIAHLEFVFHDDFRAGWRASDPQAIQTELLASTMRLKPGLKQCVLTIILR
jgi:hypothetical protein